MAAFEDFRQLLILYYDANLINDEDFVLLYDMFPSRNPSVPYYEYACFDLNELDICRIHVEEYHEPVFALSSRLFCHL